MTKTFLVLIQYLRNISISLGIPNLPPFAKGD